MATRLRIRQSTNYFSPLPFFPYTDVKKEAAFAITAICAKDILCLQPYVTSVNRSHAVKRLKAT